MKKEILVATVVYTFLTVLQPLSNFLLLPVYTKYFSEAEYGVFSILNNLNSLFSILSGLGIIHAIIAFYTRYKDKHSLNKYVGDILTFTFYFNLVLLLLTSLTGNFLFRIIFKEHFSFFPNGFLTISYGLLSNLITGYLFFLKYERKVSRYAIVSIFLFLFNTAIQYIFIVELKRSVTGALLARVIAASACFLLVFIYHYKYLFLRLNFSKNITPSLRYSLNTIPSAIIIWLTTYGDRFFIDRFLDLRSLGIYSFLATIASIIEMIFLAVGAALQPFIFDFYKSGETKKVNDLYGLFLALTVLATSFIIFVGSNLEWLIYNKGFLEIDKYLPIMAIGFVFSGFSYLFNHQIIYSQKSKYFLHIGFITLIANLSFNASLIPSLGIWGAVISNVSTKLVTALIIYFFSRKSLEIPHRNNNFYIIISFVVFIFLCWTASIRNLISFKLSSWIQIIICIVALLLFFKTWIIQTLNELRLSLSQRNSIN